MWRSANGAVHVVVVPGNPPTYRFDPTRPESAIGRLAADDALQRAAGRQNVWTANDDEVETPGSRYIDWLLPGLLGMNIMGTGLWSIGFSVVQCAGPQAAEAVDGDADAPKGLPAVARAVAA